MANEINTIYLCKKLFLLFSLSITIFSIIATSRSIYILKTSSLDNNVEHNQCVFFIILSFYALWITNGSIHELKDNYDN